MLVGDKRLIIYHGHEEVIVRSCLILRIAETEHNGTSSVVVLLAEPEECVARQVVDEE